jgi:hypothetical protein
MLISCHVLNRESDVFQGEPHVHDEHLLSFEKPSADPGSYKRIIRYGADESIAYVLNEKIYATSNVLIYTNRKGRYGTPLSHKQLLALDFLTAPLV